MLSGHICRCTGYEGIVRAILDVAGRRVVTAIPLGTVFARAVARDPDALAVVDGAVRMTYGRMGRGNRPRSPHGLTGLGIDTGDAVAAVLSNRVEMATLFWACQRIGAAFRPLQLARNSGTISPS